MPRTLTIALLLVFSCGPQASSWGGYIELEVRATTMLWDDLVHCSVEVTNKGAEPANHLQVHVEFQGKRYSSKDETSLPPGQSHTASFTLPADGLREGFYFVLVRVDYTDSNGHPFTALSTGDLLLGKDTGSRIRGAIEELELGSGTHLEVHLENLDVEPHRLTVRLILPGELASPEAEQEISLGGLGQEKLRFPLTNHTGLEGSNYQVFALVEYENQGRHASLTIPGMVKIGRSSTPGWWRSPALLLTLALAGSGFGLVWALWGAAARKIPAPNELESRPVRFAGWVVAALLCWWLADHTRPDLWLLPTWVTGGDTASHILYARVFEEWLPRGKISGWMPEVFMGFPAFRFYFPMPFLLGAVLAPFLGLPVAFKLVAMLPAILLPFGTYAMGALLRWPVAARVLGAAGAAGFVLTTSTSIWGGNLLAQLSGEFAYGWGFLWTVLFWGLLGRALRTGGRGWLLAALAEVLVALSHGYALLIAGFGAFLFPLLFREWRTLRTVLQVHALAFLLLGFWLIPLLSNLPWSIPNDTSMWVSGWRTLWPRELWPLAAGLPCSIAVLAFSQTARVGLGLTLGVAVLGLVAFHTASHSGLADIRFFPYAQWGAAVTLAAGTGWFLFRRVPLSLLWSATLAVLLLAWWEPGIGKIGDWSRWNLEGYEAKARWPAYRAVADLLAGGLRDARVVFEHDPDNRDLGSTRTVEAMPLFGSRPVLEGLYMESAISSPFIYQLQAEISERPSSPLSRFPSSKGPADAAVHHMNELYTDTLVLRSRAMKERFRNDERFEVLASEGPLLVLRLKDPKTRLVDVVDTPVASMPRSGWLDRAFRRFRLAHPYAAREIYVRPDQTWQTPARSEGGTTRVVDMDRERLVFETSAVGQPHVIRMTYHPKWRSASGEPVFLTEPAFMLMVPEQSRVELRYGSVAADTAGAWLSVLGGLLLAWFGIFARTSPRPAEARGPALVPSAIVLIVACAGAATGWWNNPERFYRHAHALRFEEKYLSASAAFERAYRGRHVPARRAEALFWSGRSLESAGDDPGALERFEQLARDYPDSYWTPESLYRVVRVAKRARREHAANAAYERLVADFPENSWTRKAIEESAAQAD